MRLLWIGLVLFVQLPSYLEAACDERHQFSCKDGECLPSEQRCNHVRDCTDGSDEVDCSYACSSPHMKPCRNGNCIAIYFFCDGENDCRDWSDELNCTGSLPGTSIVCPPNTFFCQNQMCIPQNWVCDGMDDCRDGRDELHCNKTVECKGGFQCGKECILSQWVCDGVADCADGSDEKECGPDAFMNHSCLPEHGWFSCMSKGSQKCMPINRACDGYVDCENGADEGGQCKSPTNCPVNGTSCPDQCHKTPDGPVCSCKKGLQLKGSACVDIDECSITPPLCSQQCSNTQGGYDCSCLAGYTLSNRDKQSCVANGPEPMLFITTDRDIRYISLPSKEYGLIQSGISQAHGVAGDYEDGFVYWNEKSKDKAGIYKSMLDGSAYQYVVSVGVEMVEDLAIDWVGSHVYFADSGRKHIVVCDLHGTICTVVISGQLDKPRAVAVHPEERLLFWSDWGSHPHIGSAGMDGSKRSNIIDTDIVWPNGLAIDETIQRIFWGDAKLNRIESSRLDGTDRKILSVTVTHPYALDIFEDMIYWCDPIEHEVLSANKFTGKQHKVLIKEASLTPTGIHVHHPSKQHLSMSPCRYVICSHLCLLAPNADGFKCACPIGMSLNKNNRTCDPSTSQQSSIVIATFTNIYRLTHHQIGKDSISHLPTRGVENIGALAFNPLGHSIVYSDVGHKTIYSMHLDTYRQTVLFENADMVEGLDVDPYTENIYWTEVTRGTVVIGHKDHNGKYERLVLARGLHSPKIITLASEFGLMFIVEGRISHVISVWHMDGGWRQEMVQVYGTVSAMAYDGKHLYFSDSLRGTIERIEVDGQNRTILRSHLGTPVAMDASSDSVFWLTQFSTRISWLNKQDPKTMRGFVIDATEDISVQYRLMTVVDNFDFSHDHLCLGQSGGCSDICVPTPHEAKCLCPVGKTLGADNHVCTLSNCNGDEFFKCHNNCIPAKYRCDGVDDCLYGEDEEQCHNTTTEVGCAANQFQCKNGGCVSSHFYCDGDEDCEDGSDEPSTCPPHICLSESEYACPNQHICIPRSAICDGQADCADKSDEANCSTSHSFCSPLQFYCVQSRLCIPLTWVCDRDTDCEHGEDEVETYCATVGRKPCPANHVRCPPRNDCIPRMALCNSIAECEHGTDQELCANLNAPTTDEPEKDDCSSSQYTCYLGSDECIPMASRCDCNFDCTFGEDEEGCDKLPLTCMKDLFRCPNEMRYINASWVCDGLSDCTNHADENPQFCSGSRTSLSPSTDSSQRSLSNSMDVFLCAEDEFECASGECIAADLVCDDIRQCSDGTDEGFNCSTSCINNGHCPQICVKGPRGPTCRCDVGYESLSDGHICVDIDECEGDHLCSQFCNNTKGGYRCSCAPGYTLEHDHHICKAVDGRPMLVVASNHHVELLINNDASTSRRLIDSTTIIKDIAYHGKQSTLYWLTAAGVSRSNSGGQSLIYRLNNLLPSGLALDKTSGNIYVSAIVNGTLGQDRSVIKVISKFLSADVNIITTQTMITDIALDPRRGVLFWSEHSKPYTGRIVRSSMDGRSTLWLYSIDKIMYPIALALDPIRTRVYWADLRLQSISSCDYNGQKQNLVVHHTGGQPLSLSFFENHVSWTVLDQHAVYSQMIHSNTSQQHRLHERIGHILTVHPILEPEMPNPCEYAPCNNGLCVLKNNTNFTCHCPIGVSVISSNPFKCAGESAKSKVVVIVPSESGLNPDFVDVPSSPGVTVASILICLAVLTILAVLGWIYYRRWHRTIGSPLKFRFRNALGMTEESTAWEESVDYSDRKRLYTKSDDPDDPGFGPQMMVDQNDNRTSSSVAPGVGFSVQPDSAYASQQSLVKNNLAEEHQSQQLLPASTYSMKDQLLASEL